jgi:hypothetical protein
MRTRILITFAMLAVTATFSLSLAVAAEVYKLTGVKRVESDLYRSGDVYIQTRYNYHYTYGEDAILKWDGFSGKIIWDDDSTCEVKKIFRK